MMIKNKKKFNILPWLLALFVTSGWYKTDRFFMYVQRHVDITLFLFIISMITVLFKVILSGLKISFTKDFVLIFLCFGVIFLDLIIGAFIFGNWNYGLQKTLRFGILTGWALVAPILIIRNYEDFGCLMRALFFWSIVMAISAFFRWRSGETVLFVYGLGANYIGTGRLVGVGIIIGVVFLYPMIKNLLMKLILILVVGLLLWIEFMSGGRGPALSLTLSLLIYIFVIFVAPRVSRAKSKYSSHILGLLILISIALIFVYGKKYFPVFFHRMELLFHGGGPSTLSRINNIKMAVNLFIESPIIGKGPGSLGKAFFDTDIRYYPHNIFIELASEGGIIAIGSFILLLFRVFYIGVKSFKNEVKQQVIIYTLLTLFLFVFFNSLVAGDLNDNRMLFFVASLFTINYKNKNEKIKEKSCHYHDCPSTL